MDLTACPGKVLISVFLAQDNDAVLISVRLGIFDLRPLLMIYQKL